MTYVSDDGGGNNQSVIIGVPVCFAVLIITAIIIIVVLLVYKKRFAQYVFYIKFIKTALLAVCLLNLIVQNMFLFFAMSWKAHEQLNNHTITPKQNGAVFIRLP